MIHINDLHEGVNRSGGTTPVSYATLVNYAETYLIRLLDLPMKHKDNSLLISGDLFDGFIVPNRVVLATARAIGSLIADHGIDVYAGRGNHDYAKDTTKLSSFDLLCGILADQYPDKFFPITEPAQISWGEDEMDQGWVLPHAPNQDIFDLWVKDVIEGPLPYVFVHANYNNGFAAESDHSLNLSAEQCKAMRDAGVRNIIFAHEHQQAQHPDGVIIVGNQFPTSVSDCLGNESKRALQIMGGEVREIPTWEKAGSYFECDWKELDKIPETAQFVRVKGEAEAAEASDVLDRVARLRKIHGAFVITNAVVVDGRALDVTALEAVEELGAFDVHQYILDNLETDKQREAVTDMLKEKEHA
jgi:metallophosphoesterase superfamily enzyme